MFSKICRGGKDEPPMSPSDQLKETLETLDKKEAVLQQKISVEVERAKEFTRAKNKQAAMQCLKRKKFYETQKQQLGSFQLRIRDQEQKLPQKQSLHHSTSNPKP